MKVARCLGFAAMLACAAAARLPAQNDAGILRLYQGRREIGREVFRETGSLLETTVTIPLINLKLVSRMERDAAGRPIRTEMRLYGLQTDSLQRTWTGTVDGDSVRVVTQPSGGAERSWAKRGAPDVIAADQNLSPYIHLVQQSAHQPHAWRVMLPGADTIVDMNVTWSGDTAHVAISTQQIVMVLGSDARIKSVDIPVGAVHYDRYVGTTDLPPIEGLRPPVPDYSAPTGAAYSAENVRVPVHPATGDTFSLGCTFTKPLTGGPRFPAAITLTGSGLEDRDENIWALLPEYHPFRQVAERLAASGIAVLRCDDRGYGASTGRIDSVSMLDFKIDDAAQLAYLRTRADVNPARLAIIGHSEGGIIGPMLAAEDRRVAALVVMAGTSKTMADVLRDQFLYPVERATGLTPEQRAAARQQAIAQAEAFGNTAPAYMNFARSYDPKVTARRVRQPVLIVQGGVDRQVSPGQADTLGATIRAGGNRDVTVRKFDNLNHLFLVSPSGTGAPDEYAALPDAHIPAAVLDTVATWLAARLKR